MVLATLVADLNRGRQNNVTKLIWQFRDHRKEKIVDESMDSFNLIFQLIWHFQFHELCSMGWGAVAKLFIQPFTN